MAITKCCLFFDLRAGVKAIAGFLAVLDFISVVIFSLVLSDIDQEAGVVAVLSLKISGCVVGYIANAILTESYECKPEKKMQDCELT